MRTTTRPEARLQRLFGLEGKTALVTGGARGVGRMITEALAGAGARVLIASRRGEACATAATEVNEALGEERCEGFGADLSTEAGVLALAEEVESRCERLEILVNNSGKTWGAPLGQHPWKAWEDLQSVNVAAPFSLIQALLPLMERAASADDPARVVNIGSINGSIPNGQGAYAYAASKAALHHLGRVLANELGPRHVTVNALALGPFPSKMMNYITGDEARREHLETRIPLRRIGRPDDVGGAVLWLAGAAGAWVTGAVVPIDGGMSADVVQWMDPELF
ncbi:MAG: SDR family oxidoreductase [Deltaproteobacteria bacterium]|nr:SDR family oxidoreductase [Deltaproteobacteria bacterium]